MKFLRNSTNKPIFSTHWMKYFQFESRYNENINLKGVRKKMKLKKKTCYIIGAVVMLGIAGNIADCVKNNDTSSNKEATVTKAPKKNNDISATTDSSVLKSAISKAIKDQIAEGEKIKNITVKNSDVTIDVDLSKSLYDIKLPDSELAISRASSITDAILSLPDKQEKLWNKITLNFKGIGTVTRTKKDIKTNEYDMKYFEINELD